MFQMLIESQIKMPQTEAKLNQHQEEQMKGEIHYVPNAHWVAELDVAN